jgi:peptidoglycan/xylan/chitin deacetylase (PgdA/CDA1 family)
VKARSALTTTLLLALLSGAAFSTATDAFPASVFALSHLAPHLLPPAAPDAPELLPPEVLLAPLANGEVAELVKGFDPASEERLAQALASLPLRQRLLKVAVASANGRQLALIKLQAGDMLTGAFRISDLQDDAVSALRVAFSLPLGLQQIDLWSVVPGQNHEGEIHQPVFSLCADRQAFIRAAARPRPAREIIDDLDGLVRFAPQFLRYAGGARLQDVAANLPHTAWSSAPLAENWSQQVLAASQDPRLGTAASARVIVQGPTTGNSVALTIDDGPHPLITSLMLEVLRQHNLKATFFVVGEKVEECPELLRRLVDEGHEIGNHTYSHPRLKHLSEAETLAQLRACQMVVGRVSGRPITLLRPPGGGVADHVLRAATTANSTVVLWTHNTNDWLKISPAEIAANALRDLRPGSVILMHQGDILSVRALPLIIEGVAQKGLRLTTVSDMIADTPPQPLPIPEILARYSKPYLETEKL